MKIKLTLLMIVVMALSLFGSMSIAQDEDTVTILFWQPASHLNPYLASGTKEFEAAALVLEPLARTSPDGSPVPWLATEIPTVENGGIAEDFTSITWHLQEGVLWSDGTPLTAHDVAFTGDFCMNPETGCTVLNSFANVESVEALDDLTVRVNFDGPKAYPYGPFASYLTPILQKAQFEGCMGAAALTCSDQNFGPIGTGPFVVEQFRVNDVVIYSANPNYRVEGQPAIDRIVFKGSGDAESGARAVLQTGEADFAWNLQISPDVLNAMEATGLGTVVVAFAGNVERILVNQTNPDSSLGDEMRSVWMADNANAHPFLQVPAVWQAMSKAIDRSVISEQLYGVGGQPTCNVIPGPAIFASTANDDCLVQDIDAAIAMLDAAGIVDSDGDGIREYEGIPLRVSYQTSTNAVRQSTQALIKQWWSEIGVDTELRNIAGGVFFGGDPASPDTYRKFYADVQMYTTGPAPDPEVHLGNWITSEITTPDNWGGGNIMRWYNEDFDELMVQLASAFTLEERASLAKQANDLVVQTGGMIPLVHRASVSAISNALEGFVMNAWDAELWNSADWTRAE